MECIVGTCGRNGDSFIISDGHLFPVCDSHYEQAKKIGGQLEKHAKMKHALPSVFSRVKLSIS